MVQYHSEILHTSPLSQEQITDREARSLRLHSHHPAISHVIRARSTSRLQSCFGISSIRAGPLAFFRQNESQALSQRYLYERSGYIIDCRETSLISNDEFNIQRQSILNEDENLSYYSDNAPNPSNFQNCHHRRRRRRRRNSLLADPEPNRGRGRYGGRRRRQGFRASAGPQRRYLPSVLHLHPFCPLYSS